MRNATRPPHRPASRAGARTASAENPFLALVPEVQRALEPRLTARLEAELVQARERGPEVLEMVRALADLCRRGGKRLRPALLVAGYRAVSARRGLDLALDAGVALELMQAYLLIHDDWMDGDRVRRGGPSVHALLGRRFKDQQKGDAAAILAGDYAAALASQVLAELDAEPAVFARLVACFSQMLLGAIAGQQRDLVARAPDIERTYALKTGSYTVQGPLELGALLAGARPAAIATLRSYAAPLGVAFQLSDDLLSAFGDPARTGKPFGNDLKAGKRTLLLVEALRRARGAERALLRRVAGNPKAGERDLSLALGVLESSGARARIEARIAELAVAARAALGRGLTPQGRALLLGAVDALTRRHA